MDNSQAEAIAEAMRLNTIAVDRLREQITESLSRFDETVDGLTNEIESLGEQVNLNTQELRSRFGEAR